MVYREVLAEMDPQRELYLAVSEAVRTEIFKEGVARLILARQVRRLNHVQLGKWCFRNEKQAGQGRAAKLY